MAPTREQRVDSGDRISLILIATTLLWTVQMLISIAIKEYDIFPAVKETQENYKLLAFELLTKVLGIFTVMLADWLLLNCSGGIQQTLPLAQLLFIFFSMVFAGDYGLPVAYFLEALSGTSKGEDDLKHYSLYKKAWSHNVVFQTGMYVLFTLVIFVEQIHVYRQSSGHSGSPDSGETVVNNANHHPDQTSRHSAAPASHRECNQEASPSMGYCPDLEKLIYGYCNKDVLRLSIRLVWPFILALVIVYYTHIMKIYEFTIFFFVGILILLIIFRCFSHYYGHEDVKNWSEFHYRCHPADDSSSKALQITFGVFLKVAVWGLVFLFLLIFFQELGVTSSMLTQIGIPAIVLIFAVLCLLHMSDFP